jgi:cellulose synthase operon protein C
MNLTPITQLYDQGRFVTAYQQATAQWGPLEQWQGTDARVLAGRLANYLGSQRLGAALHYLAWRNDPSHAEAALFVAWQKSGRFGPLSMLHFLDRLGPLRDLTDEVRAEQKAARALGLAQLRDFQRSHAAINAALKLAPNYAWIHQIYANILSIEDRVDEAIARVEQALRLQPTAVSVTLNLTSLLLDAGRDDDALDRLTRALDWAESGDLLLKRATLLIELGRHAKARLDIQRSRDFLPLLARDAQAEEAWNDLNAECAYLCGDYATASRLALQSHSPTQRAFGQRLAEKDDSASRLFVDVGFTRQHYNTCAPATLATLSRFWGIPADHVEIVESICYDGTPGHRERQWAESHEFIALEFRVTWESAVALLERGVPFTLTIDGPYAGHLLAVIGCDLWRRSLIARDPTSRIYREYAADGLLEFLSASGPRGMVLLPPAEISRLDGLDLPDARLYDQLYRMQVALERHQRSEAEAAYAVLVEDHPEHRLTLYAGALLAAYDGDIYTLLALTERLLEQIPHDPNQQQVKILLLRSLGRDDDLALYLNEICSHKKDLIVCRRERAWAALAEGRDHDAAEAMIRRTLRFDSDHAADYDMLATISWRKGQPAAALALLRYAACLDDRKEERAQRYYNAAQMQGQGETGLAFLLHRVECLGARSGQPAFTLAEVYLDLNRSDEAFAVAERSLQDHPDEGELLLRGVHLFGSFGQIERATRLLEEARNRSRLPEWRKAAAYLCYYRNDLEVSLQHALQAVEGSPLDISLHGFIVWLLGLLRDEAAPEEYVRSWHQRFPHQRTLHQLLIAHMGITIPLEQLEECRRYNQLHPLDPWGRRELAQTLLQLGRYPEGLAAVDEALALDRRSPKAHSLRSELLLRMGDAAAARATAETSIRLCVDWPAAIALLFHLCGAEEEKRTALAFLHAELRRQITDGAGLNRFRYYASGLLNSSEILAVLREALEARPDLLAVHRELVIHHIQMEEITEALAVVAETVERFAGDAEAWLILADAREAADDADGAQQAVEKALTLSPHWGQALLRLAQLRYQQGATEDALSLAQRACRVDREGIPPLLLLAEIHTAQGDLESAFQTLTRLLERAPYSEIGWQNLRHCAEAMGEPERALILARTLTQRHPGEIVGWRHLGELIRDVKPVEVDEMLHAYEMARNLAPNDVQAHVDYAIRLSESGRQEEALAACYPPLFGETRPIILRSLEAEIEATNGDTLRAIELMEAVVVEAPDDIHSWIRLIEWYGALGWAAAAQDALAQASANGIDTLELYKAHARALMAADDKAGALEAFDQILNLSPDNPEVITEFLLLCMHTGEFARGLPYLEKIESLDETARAAWRIIAASSQGDLALALATMQQFCRMPLKDAETSIWILSSILEHGEVTAWQGCLSDLWAQEGVSPFVGVAWVKLHLATEGPDYVLQHLCATASSGQIWVEAASSFIIGLLEQQDVDMLYRLIDANRQRLREEPFLWELVGLVMAHLDQYEQILEWMGDWTERAHVSAAALSALTVAHWGLDDIESAISISQQALANLQDPHVHWHHVMLALERLIQGDAAGGEHYLAQVYTERLDENGQNLYTLAETVLGLLQPTAESGEAPSWEQMDAALETQLAGWSDLLRKDPVAQKIYRGLQATLHTSAN